jgi:hypothetical protein
MLGAHLGQVRPDEQSPEGHAERHAAERDQHDGHQPNVLR